MIATYMPRKPQSQSHRIHKMDDYDVTNFSLRHYWKAERRLKKSVAKHPDKEMAIITKYSEQLQKALVAAGRPDVKVVVDAESENTIVHVRKDASIELSSTMGTSVSDDLINGNDDTLQGFTFDPSGGDACLIT